MSLFDSLAAILLALSLIYSMVRGMVREIFSLLAYIGGYFVATNYREGFSAAIYQYIPNTTASEIISFGLIFLACVFGISLLGKGLQKLVHSAPGLSGLDRMFGGLLGIVKGVVILIILMFPLRFFPELNTKITRDSHLAPHLNNLSQVLSRGVNSDAIFEKLPSIDLNGIKEKFKNLKDLDKLAKDSISKNIGAGKNNELPGELIGEPQDEYTKEEKNKLNDILISLEKN